VQEKERRILLREEEIKVTATEFDVFLLLARNGGEVLTREHLLVAVWGSTLASYTSVVTTLLNRLRTKLTAAGVTSIEIETVRGVGYRFVDKEPSPERKQ
jgi:two-component system alkaline phosphatase synthesis response regulator PhoP